jgi:hypothetical protein
VIIVVGTHTLLIVKRAYGFHTFPLLLNLVAMVYSLVDINTMLMLFFAKLLAEENEVLADKAAICIINCLCI